MGIISSIMEKRSQTSTLKRPKAWLLEAWGGYPTASGSRVNEETAMCYSAVYAAVNRYASSIASLPLHVYERIPEGKRRAERHPLYTVLHDMANPMMTSYVWREIQMIHVLLKGNAYSYIERDGNGQVRALWPLRPDAVRVEVVDLNGRKIKRYVITSESQGERVYLNDEIFHLPGLGYNGLEGKSVIQMAREAIGLGMAAEEFGARFFSNGAKPGGVLEHPGTLSPEARENLKKSWNKMHQGNANAHRIAILEEGMQYKQIGIPPEDAQFLETRKFQIEEIARFFNLPPHMLADLSHSSYSNIEHQSLEFVQYSLQPWLSRWEKQMHMDLLGQDQRRRLFVKFNVDALLRGDTKTRYEAYAIAKQNGWMSTDDIRELEDMNRLPNGQGSRYFEPLNMVPVDMLDRYYQQQYFNNGEDLSDQEPPGGEGREQRSGQDDPEKRDRQMQAFEMRSRITRSQERMLLDAFKRIIRREEADIIRQARKINSFDALRVFISDFYDEHPEFIKRNTSSLFHSFGQLVLASVSNELKTDVEFSSELQRFIREYVNAMANRHARDSAGRLRRVVDRAEEENRDVVEDLQTEFDEWQENKPKEIALEESVRFSNAFAKMAYTFAGVTVLTWVAGGDSCPYCEALDGRTVGVEGSFISEGGSLEGTDGKTFSPSRSISHPPLHKGCQCEIVAG